MELWVSAWVPEHRGLGAFDGPSETSGWGWWMWPKPCTLWRGRRVFSGLLKWHWTPQRISPCLSHRQCWRLHRKAQSLLGSCFNLPPLPCWMGEGNFSLNLLSDQFNTLKYNVLWPIEFSPWSCNCWPCFYSQVECLIFHWSFLRCLLQFHLPGSSTVSLVLKT